MDDAQINTYLPIDRLGDNDMAVNAELSKRDEIIAVAESMIRTRGYNGVSFRDIAAAVGVKSASVHYHFPTKADLVAAVVAAYAETLRRSLPDPNDPQHSPQELVSMLVAANRAAYVDGGFMCLSGMLAAEISALPNVVADAVRSAIEDSVDWLAATFARDPNEDNPRARALAAIASIQGALILAKGLGDVRVFDAATKPICAGLTAS